MARQRRSSAGRLAARCAWLVMVSMRRSRPGRGCAAVPPRGARFEARRRAAPMGPLPSAWRGSDGPRRLEPGRASGRPRSRPYNPPT